MKTNEHGNRAQIVYFSHGGGPLPILGDPTHKAMNAFMEKLPSHLRKPEAILVISAHWEQGMPTLQGGESPKMLYDYYGFPKEAYEIKYPAPGAPKLAEEIHSIFKHNKVASRIDSERGFDHGLYIPLKMMYPDAQIPALQLSLMGNLDPQAHLEMGKMLHELMGKNILIVGSGFSFHNLRAFDMRGSNIPDPENDAFQEWLIETCTGDKSQKDREHRLVEWEQAPYARYCHPREEHLLPLHVCVGMAQDRGEVIFDDYIAGKRAVAFLWK